MTSKLRKLKERLRLEVMLSLILAAVVSFDIVETALALRTGKLREGNPLGFSPLLISLNAVLCLGFFFLSLYWKASYLKYGLVITILSRMCIIIYNLSLYFLIVT